MLHQHLEIVISNQLTQGFPGKTEAQPWRPSNSVSVWLCGTDLED
jgi:hypothetical protein